MIQLSVLYPKTQGAEFDHAYYVDVHVPLACDALGLEPSNAVVNRGLDGPYVAAVHFTFESMEALEAAMARSASSAAGADVANYTTIRPVMQINEIVG